LEEDVVTKAKPVPSDAARPPTSRELTALLGESYAAFRALTQRGAAVTCEWKRYSQKSPWVLKVSQGDRTLFYATPKVESFEATVVLGERATEAALDGRVSRKIHPSIRAAKTYVEGRPVRIVVRGEADLASVEELVAVKLNPTNIPAASSPKRPRRPTRS
jgi:hypothetical protein